MSSSGGPAAIEVAGLGKRYRITHELQPYGRLSEAIVSAVSGPFRRRRTQQSEWIWALRDATFSVPAGAAVGIVGRNGAGKTTLLRLLTRITEPTEGRAILRGRVGSLLEVGTGFHPELTGRENVFLSGAILGMSRGEISRRFDEIVSFAGVERFIDTPIKRFSSGMQVRLGFAVAAHLDASILVLDEVLAVGDAEFQRKCLAKLDDLATGGGRTVLFVSHNLAAVESLCESAILLDQGRVIAEGTVSSVIERYQLGLEEVLNLDLRGRTDRRGEGRLRLADVRLEGRTGASATLNLSFLNDQALSDVEISVALYGPNREPVALLGNALTGQTLGHLPVNGMVACRMSPANLLPGRYILDVYCTVRGVVEDWITDAAAIEMGEGAYFPGGRLPPTNYGHVAVPQDWTVTRA